MLGGDASGWQAHTESLALCTLSEASKSLLTMLPVFIVKPEEWLKSHPKESLRKQWHAVRGSAPPDELGPAAACCPGPQAANGPGPQLPLITLLVHLATKESNQIGQARESPKPHWREGSLGSYLQLLLGQVPSSAPILFQMNSFPRTCSCSFETGHMQSRDSVPREVSYERRARGRWAPGLVPSLLTIH